MKKHCYQLLFLLLFCQAVIAQTDSTQVKDSVKSGVDSTVSTVKVKEETQYYYGYASFYSRNLENTETSTGERFKHDKLTCASNKFKLNTWLRVTNLSNDKSIIVRVNDRMHPRMAAKGRIVDLSITGAKKLDFIKKGVTKVKVEVIKKENKKSDDEREKNKSKWYYND